MNGSVRSAAGLLWRHQRLVWWIFLVNLVLAWFASLSMRTALSAVLGRSLMSSRFVSGFDLPALGLLFGQPEVRPSPLAMPMLGAAVIMLVYLLFIDGGIVSVYLEDRKLTRAEFFSNSGLYFWRMFRLALYSLPLVALLAAAHGAINDWSDKLANDAAPEKLGFYVQFAGTLLIVLLALLVRLWFDLTQARVVRDDERRLLRALFGSFRKAFSSGLYLRYLGIMIVTGAVFVGGLLIWAYLPHQATAASFVVLELATLALIASRLWMKATSARWVALQPVEFVPMVTPVIDATPVAVVPAMEGAPNAVEPPSPEPEPVAPASEPEHVQPAQGSATEPPSEAKPPQPE